MKVNTAKFVISNTDVSKCPAPNLPEYAFIGRSNVGKSSLINALAGVKGLAKTSSTPGKTQLINHFIINDTWYMVDLPGYGYAKVGKAIKEQFQKIIYDYLLNRTNMLCVFVLIDIRLTPQPIDMEFMRWLGTSGIPFSLIFTKADKLSYSQTQQALATYKETLLKEWEELPQYFVTSAEKKWGVEETLAYIAQISETFESPEKRKW